jgi:hypothetical protein
MKIPLMHEAELTLLGERLPQLAALRRGDDRLKMKSNALIRH